MTRIALIIGSVRPNRFADTVVPWVLDGAASRQDFELIPVDLRDYPLPFYDELASPSRVPAYTSAAGENWRKTIATFDGFVMTAAEYNHGPTAVLKNALDWAYQEWNHKPVGFVGYGGVGGARSVEQLRMNAIELEMAPVKAAVHIGLEPLLGVLQGGRTLDSYEYLNQSRTALFDQIAWWAAALKAARTSSALAA
jgi:NAD(P)H-dependent FMN reductase